MSEQPETGSSEYHEMFRLFGEYFEAIEESGEQNFLPRRFGHFNHLDLGGILNHSSCPNELFMSQKPVCTITVPVEILHEPLDGIMHTLKCIEQATLNSRDPIEIVLWANTRRTDNSGPAEEHFDALTKEIEDSFPYEHSWLVVRSVLTFNDEMKTISNIRANYMESIAFDAACRRFPADHPIIWLDADTTFIGPDTIPAMIQSLADNEAHFVKANMFFTGQPNDNRPLYARNDAEKVAMVYAIAKRVIERDLGPYEYRGYVDECGLGFRLGSYLKALGIDTRNKKDGESKTLLARAALKLDPIVPLVKHLSRAKLGTSHRRIELLANQIPAWQIPSRQEGDDYQMYVDEIPKIVSRGEEYKLFADHKLLLGQTRPTRPTNQEVATMALLQAHDQERFTIAQRRRIARVILRMGFAEDNLNI